MRHVGFSRAENDGRDVSECGFQHGGVGKKREPLDRWWFAEERGHEREHPLYPRVVGVGPDAV